MLGQQTADLSWRPEEGSTRSYQMKFMTSADIPGQGQTQIEARFRLTTTVKGVSDGQVQVEEKVSNFQLLFGGQDMTEMMGGGGGAPPTTPVLRTYDMRGRVLKTEGGGEMEQMGGGPRMERLNAFHRPEGGLVKLNEPWFIDFKADKEAGLQSSRARFQVVGSEVVQGVACWKIETLYAELDTPDGMSSEGFMWLDSRTGELVALDVRMMNASFNPMMPPSNARVTMTLLPN